MADGAEGRAGGDILAIAGALTVQRAAELKTVLVDALARSGGVAVDLSGVTEIDLCGLQLLCSARRTAARSGKRFALAGPTPDAVRRAAEAAGACIRSGCGAEDPATCPWKGGTDR